MRWFFPIGQIHLSSDIIGQGVVRHGKVVKARGAARGARGDEADPVIGAAPRATRADSGGCRAHPPMKTFTTGSSSHAADALLL